MIDLRENFADAHWVLGVTSALVGVGAAVSTLEWLTIRYSLAPGGLLSFDIVGSRAPFAGTGWFARIVRALVSYQCYVVVLVLRALAVAGLPFMIFASAGRAVMVVALAVVLLSTALMQARSPYGLDGSDQMTMHIYGAAFVALALAGWNAIDLALYYIAAQSALSYVSSGVAKLASPIWRRGGVSYRVFNTRTYGFELAARRLRDRPALSRFLDWTVIVVESSFPLCLVVGYPVVFLFVFWGLGFHFINAVLMGLNSFFWAFVATYPALVFFALSVAPTSSASGQ